MRQPITAAIRPAAARAPACYGAGVHVRAVLAFAVGASVGCSPAPPAEPPPTEIDLRPTTLSGFDVSYAALECRYSVLCGDGDSPHCHPWGSGHDEMLYELDVPAGHACLDAIVLATETCEVIEGRDGAVVDRACTNVVQGRLPVGADCGADAAACVVGTLCIGRVCTALGVVGAPCADVVMCEPGLVCAAAECRAAGGVGAPCESWSDCESTLYCAGAVCTPRVAAGGACVDVDDPCLDGFFCSGGGCAPEVPLRDLCTTDTECGRDGDRVVRPCIGAADDPAMRCRAFGSQLGDACLADSSRTGIAATCDTGLVCVGLRTIGIEQVGVCVDGAEPGEVCDDLRACVHGARCVTGTCAPMAAPGEACGAGTVCGAWQDCRAGRCTSAPRPGEACTTTCAAGTCVAGACCLLRIGRPCAAEPTDPCDGYCLDGRCQRVDPCSCATGQGCFTDLGASGEPQLCAAICG